MASNGNVQSAQGRAAPSASTVSRFAVIKNVPQSVLSANLPTRNQTARLQNSSATMSSLKSGRTTNHACARRLRSSGQSESTRNTAVQGLAQPPALSATLVRQAPTQNCDNVNDLFALYGASPTAASAVAAAADLKSCAVAPVVKSRHKTPNYRIAMAFRPATDSELATIVALV